MMSSAASTESSRSRIRPAAAGIEGPSQTGVRPWQFFLLAGILSATAALVLSRGADPAHIAFLTLTVMAASLIGVAVYRTLWPLAAADAPEAAEMVAGRTRVALEREKMLVLRSIKELEFDRAMGKVSKADFEEMSRRLRARALGLIRQLDEGAAGYRDLIERELASRLRAANPTVSRSAPARNSLADGDTADAAAFPREGVIASPAAPVHVRPVEQLRCAACEMLNDSDARFCKQCGRPLA